MLQTLKIENIAIIESAVINFDAGLNVLTGETGAGKSIIIDSINAILGERTSRELIRTGSGQAKVSALFSQINPWVKTKLETLGLIFQDDDSLLLQRTLAPDGKNICFANGEPVTVGILKKIGPDLINIHGQHDSQALLQSEGHYLFIDALAENADLFDAYKNVFEQLKAAEKEMADLTSDQAQKERLLDILNFQIEEIEKAELKVGEQKELINKKNLFKNSEKVLQKLREAHVCLSGQEEFDGAVRLLEMAALALSNASQYYPEFGDNAEKIRESAYALDEHVDAVSKGLALVEFDPREYEALEERLDNLYRLSRKYGESEEEMLDFLEDARKQRDRIVFSDERANELSRIIKKLEVELLSRAEELSQNRKEAALGFENKVKDELAFLDMPAVDFSVDFKRVEYSSNGFDKIEFLISANPGEDLKPLAKIASGGELSRIMLAIKNVLAKKDRIETLIFDEIDAGVSGRAAQKVALKLRQVSKGRQVICVTHLAQIAAQADCHLLISKSVSDGKTYTQVEVLTTEGRKREIARIIGGLKITEMQLRSAEDLLKEADNL